MSTNQRGARNVTANKKTYFTVSDGALVKRVKNETSNSIPRILAKGPNAGTTIYEEIFTELVGELIGINIETSAEYGKSWAFVIDASTDESDDTIILKVPYSSGYANNILFKLPNIKKGNDIKIKGYRFKDKDKDKFIVGLSVLQGASLTDKVNNYYTKDEPLDMPLMKKVKVKGVEVWDDSERLEFLEKLVKIHYPEKIENKQAEAEKTIAQAIEDGEEIPF